MTHVLIVDDQEQNLYYLEALLSGHGYLVESARHGIEALHKARAHPPALVISDLLMPIMDGYSLLRHWKADALLSVIPFVVYTATYTEPEDEKLALNMGADRYIRKPAEPDEFLAQLRAVLHATAEARTAPSDIDETGLLRHYSQTLIRKLEERSLRLEEANRALVQELAERRQVEESLRRSEANQQQLTQQLINERARLVEAQRVAKVGSWETDIATGSVQWSDETHRIFATDTASFAPTHDEFLNLVHPEDRDRVRRAFDLSQELTGPNVILHRLVCPDGSIKHVEERWHVFRDAQGHAVRALGTCRDISEQKQAEAEIRRSANLLQAVVDGTADAVFVKDIDGRYLMFNEGAARLVGKRVDEVLGGDDRAVFVADGAARLMADDQKVMSTGLPSFTEETLTANGITRHYEYSKAPYRDDQGRVIGLVGIARDVSERKRAEALQRDQALLLANAQRIGRMGSWSLDLRTEQLIWSEATSELFGLAVGEFAQTRAHFQALVHPEDRAVIDRNYAAATRSMPTVDAEYRIRRGDGTERWMYERGVIEFDDDGLPLRSFGMVMDITEQKLAREQLAQNAALLRMAGRLARLGGWTIRLPARELFWSDQTALIHDVAAGTQIPFSDALAFYPAERRADVEAQVNACIRDGTPFDIESPIITAQGRRIWIHALGERVGDGSGVQLQGAVQDISEQKEAAEAIRISEERFREMAENMGDLFYNYDTQKRELLYASPAYERLWGRSCASVYADPMSYLEQVHVDDRPMVDLAFRHQLAGDESNTEFRIISADGHLRWIHEHAVPIRNAAQQVERIVGTMRDVTDRHLADEKLRASEQRFRLLAKATNDAIRDLDLNTQQLWWSEGFETLFGFARDAHETTIDSWIRRIHIEDRERVLSDMRQAIDSGGEAWVCSYRFARKDGRFAFVWDRSHVIRDSEGRPQRMVGGMADISEQRKAEAALQQSLTDLNHRNKELQEFAFAASHDLQEPLRKIRTYADVINVRHSAALDPQARDYLERMNQAASRMQVLIDDLLAYSRVTSGAKPFAPTDLALICREVLYDLEARVDSVGAQVEIAELPVILGDATQMRQLFQNLLANALKFHGSDRKPEIRITATAVTLHHQPAWQLEFIDNGIGFEPRFAERIFSPFQRLHTRSEYEGTGMGLAIVRRIVERHRGSIVARGEPGQGACFTVVLPTTPVNPT